MAALTWTADTNVWVRYLTNDDPEAAARVMTWLRSADRVHLGVTVILELEWVLRAAYGFDRAQVQQGLRQVAGLPQVEVAQAAAVARALDLHAAGLDFADALHAALAPQGAVMATLDRGFAAAGAGVGVAVLDLHGGVAVAR